MPNRVSVTSSQSWFSRLASSIKSVVFGLLLFLFAFPLLFWNEGRAVKRARSLTEGAGVVASVASDSVDPANEGRLVHTTGFSKTEDTLMDDTFGVSETGIKLVRDVEMFQWQEHSSTEKETKLGGSEETTTTYEYDKGWSSRAIDSNGFHSPAGHENPGTIPYEAMTMTAQRVTLGAFELSPAQVDSLSKSEPLGVDTLPPALSKTARLHDGAIYIGADPTQPAVGDVRVRFRIVRPGPVSLVAQQAGSSFSPYQTEAGGTILLLEEAISSADVMFEAAQTQNAIMTWILRAVGFFAMLFGLSMIFNPIAVFGDVVPIVGSLLGAGVGLFATLVAAFFSFITIGIAWVFYRPLLGIALLLLAAGAIYALVHFTSGRKSASMPPPIPPPVGAN